MSEQQQINLIALVKKNIFSLARYLYELDNNKLYNLYVDFYSQTNTKYNQEIQQKTNECKNYLQTIGNLIVNNFMNEYFNGNTSTNNTYISYKYILDTTIYKLNNDELEFVNKFIYELIDF